MAIVVGATHKKTFKDYAQELHQIAKPLKGFPESKQKVAVEALAVLFDKFTEMEIPFCELDRFCYFLIKDAAKAIERTYYTPDEVLEVVKNEIVKDKANTNESAESKKQ